MDWLLLIVEDDIRSPDPIIRKANGFDASKVRKVPSEVGVIPNLNEFNDFRSLHYCMGIFRGEGRLKMS